MDNKQKKKRGGRICCVPGCSSRSTQVNHPEVHFYSFPNREWERERKQLWIARVRRITQEGRPWIPTKTSTICSNHFVGGVKSNDPRKENYNPSIFPWKLEKVTSVKRRERLKRRNESKNTQSKNIHEDLVDDLNILEEISSTLPEKPTSCDISIQTDAILYYKSEDVTTLYCWQDASKNEASTQTNISVSYTKKSKTRIIEVEVPEKVLTKNIAVGPDTYVRTGFQWFADIHGNNSTMKQLGGINLSFFHILLNFVKPKAEGQPHYYRVMNSNDRLLLFLMKMKLGIHFSALSCIFQISKQSVSNIFYEILETLYECTKTWIFWPSKETIKKLRPPCFQKYPNCRAIIDSMELRCETPPTGEGRALMYSTCKSDFTVKYLIAITPTGFISFVSKGYGGRSSVSDIINDSGFIHLIEPGDEIMADKGFPQINTELLKQNSALIMLPFTHNPQFSEEKGLEGSIASVRIHVERSIQRIRTFKVLDFISINLMTHADKIMYMACVLANNKEPLIKN